MQTNKKYTIGDLVTIVRIPPALPDDTEMKTKRVFEICIGKTYTIQAFDEYGHIELAVGKDVDHIIGGFMNTIWIEPEFVVSAKQTKGRDKN